jgi:catechol-2,3-dioxygenase
MTTKSAATPARKRASNIFQEARSFSSFSVNDLKKAKEFYGDKLGLDVAETKEGLELNAGDIPASFTVLNFPSRTSKQQ